MNNVIIFNKQKEALSSLSVDAIKELTGEFSVEEIVSKFENFFYERMIIDITAIKGYKDIKNLQAIPMHLDSKKIIILLDGSVDTSAGTYLSKLVSMGIYNFTQNKEGVEYLIKNPNSYKDVAQFQELEEKKPEYTMARSMSNKTKVLGIKNITHSAGSSTLIYMLKKQLESNYRVAAIEIDKDDFIYFNDKNMISTNSLDLGKELIKLNDNVDIVLIDLNFSNNDKVCNDILYLIEPSIIRMNELVSKNKEVLKEVEGKKIILNKSLLSPKDIEEFELEAGMKVFYNIPPLNDRQSSRALDGLLVKLGFLKQKAVYEDMPEERKSNLYSKITEIFKRNN